MSSAHELLETPIAPSTVSREILDSNAYPDETHIPALRDFVSRGKARRTRLDEQLAYLQSSMNKLLEQRDPLDIEIRKHEGALSPLRRMPPELLLLIFEYAMFPHYPSAETPWTVAAVCRHWRKIALSQPSLWSTVVLDFTDPKPIVETETRLQERLERSRPAPLHITFTTWDECQLKKAEALALDILAEHCDRWETAAISGPEHLYSRLAFQLKPGDLSHLRELRIRIHLDIHKPGRTIDPINVSALCPALQVAVINPPPIVETSVTVQLPPQVACFVGSNPWSRHLHTLGTLPNLVECALHGTDSSSIPAGVVVTLPSLTRLSVSSTSILQSLHTPALQELYCCDQTDHLYPFLQRLSDLKKLIVARTLSPKDPGDTGPLLRAVPATVHTLGLYVPINRTDNLFSALQPVSPISTVESIALRLVGSPDWDTDTLSRSDLDEGLLMQTIESNWHQGHWRSVRLHCPNFSPSLETRQRVEALQTQGMQITVFDDAYSLYCDLVPPDFRLFMDHMAFFDY